MSSGPLAGLPSYVYAREDQETFNYQYPQAQSHAPTTSSYVVNSNGVSPYFESQFRSLEYRPASSTVSAGASYAAAAAAATSTPTMPQKRPSEDDSSNGSPVNSSPAKHMRTERPEEFSKAVLKKLKDSNRTGQACDRCKVRKIRCDPRESGCGPCEQNATECVTTDRITGLATRRGYTDALERQNRNSRLRIEELERQVIQLGGNIKSPNGYQNAGTGYEYQQPAPTWNATNSYPPQDLTGSPRQETNIFRPLPVPTPGACGSTYLGVSAGNSNLSAIKGTALTILGMEIDIANFDSWDMDEPKDEQSKANLYNKSYQSFLQTALNVNPKVTNVELPERSLGFEYASWYFRALNPYTPLLHKNTHMKMLARFYDDPTFRPTTAETVMVHMVFAIMLFQFSVRNNDDMRVKNDYNVKSNMHYHYSLNKFYELSCSHTVQDVQAMTLICLHLRNFPKPGASWILTQNTMSLAIELGLHLSAKRWVVEARPNLLDIEMRKRTFWVILAIQVTLSGKLGRPMSLRYEDYDVEFPEVMDDDLLSEDGLDTSRPGNCTHEIGLVAMRILPLYMELYSNIYAVRRYPDSYITTVKSLEARVQSWRDNLPPHLQLTKETAGTENRPFALYAEMWYLEFRLLLRHPSVEMTDDKAFKAEGMRACDDCARQMLSCVMELQQYNTLDTTWYNAAVYVMAITTTLFATHDKKSTTSAEIAALRADMDKWLNIMGDVGRLLGSGDSLKEAVRGVIEGTLGMLDRRVTPPNPSYIQNSSSPADSKMQLQRSDSDSAYGNMPGYALEQNAPANGLSTTEFSHGQVPHHTTPYPAATVYSTYAETPSTIAYTPHDNSQPFANYPPSSNEPPLLGGFQMAPAQTQQNDQWQRSISGNPPGAQAWQQWAHSIGQVESQDRYSASALISLNARDSAAAVNGAQTAMSDMNGLQPVLGFDQSMGNLNGVVNSWPQSTFLGQGQEMGPGSG
ncbi:hypothetical protein ONS95_004711 [Cadophora gregata]|uniref:uncharacterized protein n=1 Tax=Cadophora gregata TaxID=51156 RepID=UPI0026DCC435|nr:uncharacterized protein ONS95_004711 [Cadophora gregata]KAK0104418.1 hypothetical protein ONS95_004711 [Cadophora gregata]KAK0115486.1 hypothetical protein ONS96_013941 [Cadophora gregata f. sp. sojae]